MKSALIGVLLFFLLQSQQSFSQCTWSSYIFDSYEYATTIPDLIPGKVYQNTPQTYAGCIRTGSKGMYLNIVDGQSGLLYSRTYNTICAGKQYRFSFSVRDAWSSTNNLTFNIFDGNNVLLGTQTVITNSVWQDITMPAFTSTTTTIRFEIVTNIAGGPGNDAGFDDLRLSACNQTPLSTTLNQCAGSSNIDLFSLISASSLSNNGTWTGPTSLQNGYQGTFVPGTNTNGNYTYSIPAGLNCPDSTATVVVSLVGSPNINPINPLSGCGSVILPAITGINLTGQQKYYTQPNGAGTAINAGTVINSSQTLYAFDGIAGCSDQEIVTITISTAVNAGNDNAASYCGPGQTVSLPSFLSSGTTAGGIWAETTNPLSGGFNPTTGQWNTSSVLPGNYMFTYTLPANGACAGDVSNFVMNIGGMSPVNLGNDTTLCTGQTLWLNAGSYSNYLWNNGSTNSTKFVNTAGTYWVRVGTIGANLIVNGNFEAGNTGFTTDYIPGTGGSWGLLSNPGQFAMTSSPSLVHNNFANCTDQTANPGTQMMVVNGGNNSVTNVWCQTVPVQPNTSYQLGAYAMSVVNSNYAPLQFKVNGSLLGSIFSPVATTCTWTQFTQSWNSGTATTAQVCIVNQSASSASGNDFAIDEITFKPICYKYDTIVVTYGTNPVVNLGPDQQHCEIDNVILDAGNAGSTFSWNTTETSQQINPTTAGTYSVTVTSPLGCTGTDQINLSFEALKTAGFDSSTNICSTLDAFDMNTLQSSNTDLGGLWSTADFTGNFTPEGQATFSGETGTFHFDYVVSGILCPNDTSTMSLVIFEQPIAGSGVDLHFCNSPGSTEDLSLYTEQPVNPNGGYWAWSSNLDPANINTSTAELSTGNLAHDNYQLQYILLADAPCLQDTFPINVKVTQVPDVNFLPSVTEGCQPLEVTFEDQSTTQGTVEYLWDFGNGEQSTTLSGNTIVYENAVCHDVSLTITADGLCTSTFSADDLICAFPLPVADFTFGPQQVYSDGPSVVFENNSVNNDMNSWDFGDGFTSQSTNPEHTYAIGEIGNYEVVLIVETVNGCLDTASNIVQVKDQLLYYVPNSFTPDGDQYNNVFTPVLTAGFDLMNYQMDIYNRWGERIFETHDAEIGWDGSYNGTLVQEGTYTWKIRVELIENDDILEFAGSVTILK